MSIPMTADYEYELEGEWEGEFEGEYESEEFFRRLADMARRAAQSPTLRRVASRTAHAARRAGVIGRIIGLTLNPPDMPALPPPEPPVMVDERRRRPPHRPPSREFEWEYEAEANPLRRVYPDALMEHFGHAAAEAESEAEAEAFVGALIPLAARLAPRVAPAIMRAAPGLIRGTASVARTLRSQPTTRPLVRMLPTIVRRTAASMARQQAAQGRPVTPTMAVRTLARQTGQVLSNPHQCARAWQRSRALDRRYHRTTAGAGAAAR
jgi:hypothetical protein